MLPIEGQNRNKSNIKPRLGSGSIGQGMIFGYLLRGLKLDLGQLIEQYGQDTKKSFLPRGNEDPFEPRCPLQ